jgi:hypothetical protein
LPSACVLLFMWEANFRIHTKECKITFPYILMFMLLDSKRYRHYSFIRTCVQQCLFSRSSMNNSCPSHSVLRIWNQGNLNLLTKHNT